MRRSKRGDVAPSEEAEDEWSDGEDNTAIELKITEYFIKNSYLSSPSSFIAYNSARGWRGFGGEDVRAEYVRYADEWERSYRTRNGLNPDLDAP